MAFKNKMLFLEVWNIKKDKESQQLESCQQSDNKWWLKKIIKIML